MRLARAVAVLSVVLAAAPALACYVNGAGVVTHRRGVGIQLGSVFFGFSKYRAAPCPQVLAAPPVVVAPPPVVIPQAPVVYSAPPIVYAQPATVAVAPAPVIVQPPAPPPVVQARAAPAPVPVAPARLALKYMPGASATVALDEAGFRAGQPGFAHSPGLELRLANWFALRSDLEFRQDSRTWDMLGAKLSLFPNSAVRPYASVSLGATELLADPGRYSLGVAGAGGLDVFFGRHFFLEAEVRYRVMPGACCSEVPSLTGVVGLGVAFF